MKANVFDVLLLNAINWVSVAVLTLNEVKDIVAIILGVVTTVSTLLIIRGNWRSRGKFTAETRRARRTEEADLLTG